MYVIIAGAGKVGWNLARELQGKGHETTQTVGTKVYEFDDRAVARQLLETGR